MIFAKIPAFTGQNACIEYIYNCISDFWFYFNRLVTLIPSLRIKFRAIRIVTLSWTLIHRSTHWRCSVSKTWVYPIPSTSQNVTSVLLSDSGKARVEPSGSAPIISQFGQFSLILRPMPVTVPPVPVAIGMNYWKLYYYIWYLYWYYIPVPAPITTISTWPSHCCKISSPVPS